MAPPIVPVRERFFSKISPEPMSGCWLWTGSYFPLGYGQFHIDRRPRLAHRVAYELIKGPIPEGLELDHKCHNRPCVNPDHLRTATRRQNQSNLMGKAEGKFSSRFVGVHRIKDSGRWAARIHVDGRSIRLGTFALEEDAASAYEAARSGLS